MAKLLVQTSGKLQELATLAASAGAGSAGGIPNLDANGLLDPSFMPATGFPNYSKVASNTGFTSLTATNITGLSVALVSGVNALVTFGIILQSTATTVKPNFTLTGPAASFTHFRPIFDSGTTTADSIGPDVRAYSTVIQAGGTLVKVFHLIECLILGTTGAGTLQLQLALSATGTITIYAGSYCRSELF